MSPDSHQPFAVINFAYDEVFLRRTITSGFQIVNTGLAIFGFYVFIVMFRKGDGKWDDVLEAEQQS